MVREQVFPSESYLFESSKKANYSDSYVAHIEKRELSIYEIYQALAKATPRWANTLMALRDGITSFFKLKPVGALGSSAKDFRQNAALKIGEKLDAFTLFYFDDSEIVVGEDDRHLNFRLSILKQTDNEGTSVALSMIVFVHNLLGRSYLFFILPFHKIIMRKFLINTKVILEDHTNT